MIGNILSNTAHKEVGDAFSSMGRDTDQIGLNAFTVIQDTPLYAVITILIYGDTGLA